LNTRKSDWENVNLLRVLPPILWQSLFAAFSDLSSPLQEAKLVPIEIRLSDHRRSLVVVWEDASISRLGARCLRANSRASAALRAALDGAAIAIADDVEIREILPVGQYAINLIFSDGHDRGIYPWPFLRELSDKG
jgi:DUF971 family protein